MWFSVDFFKKKRDNKSSEFFELEKCKVLVYVKLNCVGGFNYGHDGQTKKYNGNGPRGL